MRSCSMFCYLSFMMRYQLALAMSFSNFCLIYRSLSSLTSLLAFLTSLSCSMSFSSYCILAVEMLSFRSLALLIRSSTVRTVFDISLSFADTDVAILSVLRNKFL